jgi:hypothetical protein
MLVGIGYKTFDPNFNMLFRFLRSFTADLGYPVIIQLSSPNGNRYFTEEAKSISLQYMESYIGRNRHRLTFILEL